MTPPCTSPQSRIGRRKAFTVMAAALGAALPGSGLLAATGAQPPTLEWRGRALGTSARIVIRHADEVAGRRLLSHCIDEIGRLENVFSLYRATSEISRLNRDGRVQPASLDLRLALSEARRFGDLSGGAFDVTIQPLWRLYEEHFAAHPDAGSGPEAHRLEQVARLVDYSRIDLDSNGVRLAGDGMAVSLNGIAQGYFTDRIAELLRDGGMADVLVDLGEIRAIGSDADGPWRIAVQDPSVPGASGPGFVLRNAAVATSGGYGTRFDRSGRFHHLFDPATGTCPSAVLSATAVAPTALQADALATALAVAPPSRAKSLVRAFRATGARLVLADGRTEFVNT